MTTALAVALLSLYPAWIGTVSGWVPGIALGVFVVFLVEPLMLKWELRRSGDLLQITDDGVLRRLPRGASEYVRWSDLREVSLLLPQAATAAEEYFYVLAGSGKSGVVVNQALATRHDLLAHLDKLPGFDPRGVSAALGGEGGQHIVIWRARTFTGEATVIPLNRLEPPRRTLH